LFAWAQMHPVLMNHLLAITHNFNRRQTKQKASWKSQACNVLLAYPKRTSHGLWIELKKQQEAKLAASAAATTIAGAGSEHATEQSWMHALQAVGYEVKVAYGWQQAVREIEAYLAK